jgi:Icc-related predicted phosphoesterase
MGDVGTSLHPIRVGDATSPSAQVVRIVHISDTHQSHEAFKPSIPDGDILIHSGDFAAYNLFRRAFKEYDYLNQIKSINQFFNQLPHRHKIFVAGNHELHFDQQPVERTQSLITSATYLQDSSVVIEGIKFFGTPWTEFRPSSSATAFTAASDELKAFWDLIPSDTDVLVTHHPPLHILDLGQFLARKYKKKFCETCSEHHERYMHYGCPHLRDSIK